MTVRLTSILDAPVVLVGRRARPVGYGRPRARPRPDFLYGLVVAGRLSDRSSHVPAPAGSRSSSSWE